MDPSERRHLRGSLLRAGEGWERALRAAARDARPALVHDLRVASRRLRATLWIWRQAGTAEGVKPFTRRLRHLIRDLGLARDDHVACVTAAKLGLGGKREKKRKTWRRAERALRHHERLEQRWAKLRRHLCEAPPTAPALAALRERAARWEPAPRTARALHRLRRRVRQARYALEALGRSVPALANLQRALGRIHDLEITQQRRGSSARLRRARKELRRRLPPLVAKAAAAAHRQTGLTPRRGRSSS